MLGDFSFCNPTKLYFGTNSLCHLKDELAKYGKKILFVYGGGSIKRNGIYDAVVSVLKSGGKEIVELGGVMPNPTSEKLVEGCNLARAEKVDFILAVGGGSVIDYAKGVSVGALYDGDPWENYYLKMEEPANPLIPVGAVLTMVGTGSEMNGGSVITNHEQKLKIGHVFGEEVFPKFAILNPEFTFSVPKRQMVAGVYDIFNHICEQYFSGNDDNTSDYISEGLLKSVVHSSKIAVQNPNDYEARSNLMWTATWALNTLIAKGKTTDWMVHMIGQAVGAYTDATHGMTLSAVSLAYYKTQMEAGLSKFVRFAKNVFDVPGEVGGKAKSDMQIAHEGLDEMKKWMQEIGVTLSLKELGVTPDMFDGIASATFIMDGGYKTLSKDDVIQILKESM
ncbi:MAG: iron-containing alcohol dehydrogenase [Treponema sp.]|nr:iron-containing alcohol dehydrogenase [Treponema sp.]